jgi:hypothetical protein
VPASDSDEEARGESALEGPLREREEYVAQAVARRHGISSTVRPLRAPGTRLRQLHVKSPSNLV